MERNSRRKQLGSRKAVLAKFKTSSSQKHRFEPFSQRIAKLRIDPIRRTATRTVDDNDLSTSTSYFKTALDNWIDLNLSQDFTDFTKRVGPLCGSLPQILHYEDKIMDLLTEYIAKGHTVSLEPLLDLLSQFAHDLGVRFEKHFEKAVSEVARLAAAHPDVEVIEWSFNCLTWLFKYLSRLLAPDLRPVYNLMAPLLGKERQKPFITRFAAEALSFLVRKAAGLYHKNEKALSSVTSHILSDLVSFSKGTHPELYEHGLMALFAESIRGVQDTLHSTGSLIFKELMDQTFKINAKDRQMAAPGVRVLEGVLIATMHHASRESFEPIQNAILQATQSPSSGLHGDQLDVKARLLLVLTSVLHGSRVSDWNTVLEQLRSYISWFAKENVSQNMASASGVLSAVAVAHQNCPLNVALSALKWFDLLRQDAWLDLFLGFCMLYAELGKDRFKDFLFPHFQKFIAEHWSRYANASTVCLLQLRQLELPGILASALPFAWQYQMLNELDIVLNVERNPISVDSMTLYKCSGFLELLSEGEGIPELTQSAVQLIKTAWNWSLKKDLSTIPSLRMDFIGGSAFKYALRHGGIDKMKLGDWEHFSAAVTFFESSPLFWTNILEMLRRDSSELHIPEKAAETGMFMKSLLACLASPSHELRSTALEILQVLASTWDRNTSILEMAVAIENTTPTLQTIRSISMQMRQVAAEYRKVSSIIWVSQAIPSWCFGLLHVKFAQIWDDSCAALKEICNSKQGEDIVCELAFEWLNRPVNAGTSVLADDMWQSPERGEAATEFESAHLLNALNLARKTATSSASARQYLERHFQRVHRRVPMSTEFNRAQALKLLRLIPHVGEKRSRLLVPVLLSWALDHEPTSSIEEDGTEDNLPDKTEPYLRWARKDQKAMLSLFAQFTNPRALFKSEQVHDALLALLMHGDVDIQRSAFKALLTWKQPNVNRYEEDLMKFFDSSTIREQLAVFLCFGQDNRSLQEEHRKEVMPFVLRILYGRTIIRGKADHSIRKSIFLLLSRLNEEERRCFFAMALGSLAGLTLVKNGALQAERLDTELLDLRKQQGLLTMLKETLDILQTTASPFVPHLADPVVYCLLRAARMERTAEDEGSHRPALVKSIRQLSLYCLNALFEIKPDYDWDPYAPEVFANIVEPRVQKLPTETTSAVSGLLRFLATWSGSPMSTRYLTAFNPDLPHKLAECLAVASTKAEVKQFVLKDILGALMDQAEKPEDGHASAAFVILSTAGDGFLNNIAIMLRQSVSKDLLDDTVNATVRLSNFITPSNPELLRTATFLVTEPSRRVSRSAKVDLLQLISKTLAHVSMDRTLADELLPAICSSFAIFADRVSRLLLCDILSKIAEQLRELQEVAQLCDSLNAFSSTRLDQPDFACRTEAFNIINEEKYGGFTGEQWLPILNNMMFFIKDTEELVIRASSSFSIRRFIEATSMRNGKDREEFLSHLRDVVISGIERGLKDQPELVRMEYLNIVVHAVKYLPNWESVAGLTTLTDKDEEASILHNLLHIQQHRRVRALQRLGAECAKGTVIGHGLAHIIIPLVERFIFDGSDGVVAGEAVRTICVLLEWVDWSQFRAIVRRYTAGIKKAEELEETMLKLVDGASIALSRAASSKFGRSQPGRSNTANIGDVDMQDVYAAPSRLSQTLPNKEKLAEIVAKEILPTLTGFLRDRDESVVSRRTLVAVTAVRLLQNLPETEFSWRFAAVLTDTCNILRSKDQGSRDMARKALASICGMVGPSSVGFVIKELRRTLNRGFFLHVLSFTVHTILESTVASFASGDLDYCVSSIVAVVMEDIFGNTAEEKDAAEYIKNKESKKEIRGRKSFDTMQLLAQVTSLHHQIDLLRPIETLLLETLNNKMVRDVDEVLRRIGLGLLNNQGVHDRDVLIFCFEIIQDAYKIADGATTATPKNERKSLVSSSYLMKAKLARASTSRSLATMTRIGKIVRFAFELLRGTLRKQKDLATPENLDGFMPIIGDAVISSEEEIKLAALRLFTSIITIPLPQIDEDAPVYVAEAAKVIEERQGAHDELSQAALKLISAVLREKKNVKVKDHVVATLLKRLKPDLQIISQQGSAFNLLRAIIARKVIIPEVYELMDGEDGVAAISIRDHDRTTRDLARGVYFAFILDYPQSDKRFAKQITFLIGNLEYKHAEGRQSVMETLYLLLTKLSDQAVERVIKETFWPLVSVMLNDTSSDCRNMASRLLRSCFERATNEWLDSFLKLFKKLLESTSKAVHRRTALQTWTLYLEAKQEDAKNVKFVTSELRSVLESESGASDEEWQLIYFGLHTFLKICEHVPHIAFAPASQGLWQAVTRRLLFPQAWVKSEASKLIELYLQDFARTSGKSLDTLPLTGSSGLRLSRDEICTLMTRHVRLLRVGMTQELADQTKRNLAYLGRFLAASNVPWHVSMEVQEPAEELDEDENSEDNEAERAAEHAIDTQQTALNHLIDRLANILKREDVVRRNAEQPSARRHESLIPRTTALELLTAFCSSLPASQILPSLKSILLSIAQVTASSTTAPFTPNAMYNETYKKLVENTETLASALQAKIGTTEYVRVMQSVREEMRERREERRRKRKIEAVAAPDKFEKSKQRKRDTEKARKKEKGLLMRGRRRGW